MMYRALVVKPMPCCGFPDGLGMVVEVVNEYPLLAPYCGHCGAKRKPLMAAQIRGAGQTDRERLVPLPPESECVDQVDVETPVPVEANQ